MALLTVDQRKKRFKALGLGEYNEKNILKFQKKAFPKHKAEHDSKYGPATDRALRHFYNCSLVKDFKPEEFRCDCGRCNGYPSYMKQVELKNLQKIRTHYGKPMTVTSGLRCSYANSASRGSVPNSGHLHGYACDFYMPGVTDTLANRKKSIKYMKGLANTQYVYGNGINSLGASVQAAYMGNAMHYETHKPPKAKKATAADPLQKWFDAMETQFKWSKDQIYYFVKPTVASSRKKGTCITFPAVSLQRLGLIPKGSYFYFHPQKKKISGTAAAYVKNHSDIFKLSYPNKTIKELWKAGKIKKGDIIGFGNPGYHTMVFMGMNSKGQPIFNTMGHKRGLKVTYPSYAKRKVNMLVRIKKVR